MVYIPKASDLIPSPRSVSSSGGWSVDDDQLEETSPKLVPVLLRPVEHQLREQVVILTEELKKKDKVCLTGLCAMFSQCSFSDHLRSRRAVRGLQE
jgi:hypothetical protein